MSFFLLTNFIDRSIINTAYPINVGIFIDVKERLNDPLYQAPQEIHTLEVKGKIQQYALIAPHLNNEEKPKGTVVFFHGNAVSIHELDVFDLMQQRFPKYNIIMIEYPGYPGSEGTPSKKNISTVTDIIFDHIKEHHSGFLSENLIACGESIGGYHAARFAQKNTDLVKGLVLVSTYSSTINTKGFQLLARIVKKISDEEILDTESILKTLPPDIAVSIGHGRNDHIFGVKMNADKNFEASQASNKHIEIFENSGHYLYPPEFQQILKNLY